MHHRILLTNETYMCLSIHTDAQSFSIVGHCISLENRFDKDVVYEIERFIETCKFYQNRDVHYYNKKYPFGEIHNEH